MSQPPASDDAVVAPQLIVECATVPQTVRSFVLPLLEHLADAGEHLRVHVVCGPDTHVTAAELSHPSIEGVTQLPLSRGFSPMGDLRATVRLALLLRRLQPDAIHVQTPKASLVGLVAAFIARTPIRLLTLRGSLLPSATGFSRVVLWVAEAITLVLAHRSWAVGHSLRNEFIRLRVPGSRSLRVIGSGSGQGVDTARFDPAAVRQSEARRSLGLGLDVPVVVFIGRLVADKGVRELSDVWRWVSTERPDAWLLIVGDDDEPRDVDREALAQLSSMKSVVRCGRVRDPERYLAAADVLLYPSHREGFSNVMLEAASMALPIVGFDVTGVRDGVEDGQTGVLVEPFNCSAMTEQLLGLLGDQERAEQMGRAGRRRIEENFDRADVLPAKAAAIREAVGDLGESR